MMRVKVLSDGANGRIILSSAIEMGCGLPDHQIFADFGSPRCIKSRTLPRSLQRRLRRHTTAHGIDQESEELEGKGRAMSRRPKADEGLSQGIARLARGAWVLESADKRR